MNTMHRVAIIGAGIGAQHLDGFLALPGHFRVCNVCDLDTERATALAARAPGCVASNSIDALLADPDIDIVDICLPPDQHGPVAIAALQAGKHVICEKPLASSVLEADTMAAAAIQAGRVLAPVFQYRYGRGLYELDALRKAGLAGKPLVATVETHWNRDAHYYATPWRGTWAGERGGAILGHAIHAHDLIAQLFGPIRSVSAMLDTRVNRIETEDCAALAMTTESGALVTSSVTLGGANDMSRLRLVFDSLTVESARNPYAPGQGPWQFSARDPADQAAVAAVLRQQAAEIARRPQGYAGQWLALAERLAGREASVVSVDDAVRSIELVAAIYLAARDGQRVSLPVERSLEICADWSPAC